MSGFHGAYILPITVSRHSVLLLVISERYIIFHFELFSSALWLRSKSLYMDPIRLKLVLKFHLSDVIMSAMASQVTSLTSVYSNVYSGADQRKHQSPTSLAFVRRIPWWPVNYPHNWPATRKMFPFDDVIMGTFITWDAASCIGAGSEKNN